MYGYEMFAVLMASLGASAYGIGSIPIHRLFGLSDIDAPDQKHVRWRSVARVLLNVLKGFVVVKIGLLTGMVGGHIALYAVTFGHMFPIWSTFRGGTGLGVILGATIALDPTLGLLCLASWTFAYYSFLDRTVAALTAAVTTPFFVWFLQIECPPLLLLPVTGLVIWSHRKRFSDWYLDGPAETEDHFRHL